MEVPKYQLMTDVQLKQVLLVIADNHYSITIIA